MVQAVCPVVLRVYNAAGWLAVTLSPAPSGTDVSGVAINLSASLIGNALTAGIGS
jgi:hypothetical protein